MCTIITVSKEFWDANRVAVIEQILSDARINRDGVTATLIGLALSEDVQLSAMGLKKLLPTIEDFMDNASPGARVFLHQRMATTAHIGIAYNHGFTNSAGTIIMHNGVLQSTRARGMHVDSFALNSLKEDETAALMALISEKETYANVFRIYPNKNKYDVLRLAVGTLYTDGMGNYSSNRIGPCNQLVSTYSAGCHVLHREVLPVDYKDSIEGDLGFEDYPEDSAENLWEFEEEERLLIENSMFFVLYNKLTNKISIYESSTGILFYEEAATGEDIVWQARLMLDESIIGIKYGDYNEC